jgi:hypothetical protein
MDEEIEISAELILVDDILLDMVSVLYRLPVGDFAYLAMIERGDNYTISRLPRKLQ